MKMDLRVKFVFYLVIVALATIGCLYLGALLSMILPPVLFYLFMFAIVASIFGIIMAFMFRR